MLTSRLATWFASLSRLEIGIIAVMVVLYGLHGLVVWGGDGSLRENARRQDAASVSRAIVAAMENYRADHGHFPALGQPRKDAEKFVIFGDRAAGCPQSNGAIFDVLRAIPRGANENHALNPRQVKYFEGKKVIDPRTPRDGFADGAAFPAEIQGRFYDPWGGEYCVLWETDNDASINVGPIFQDLADSENTLAIRAAAFSLGRDSAVGGKGYPGRYRKEKSSPPDDIASWQ